MIKADDKKKGKFVLFMKAFSVSKFREFLTHFHLITFEHLNKQPRK